MHEPVPALLGVAVPFGIRCRIPTLGIRRNIPMALGFDVSERTPHISDPGMKKPASQLERKQIIARPSDISEW